MNAVAQKNKTKNVTRKPLSVDLKPRLVWRMETEPEPEPVPERGDDAVQHSGVTRGRRSKLFPDLNITATADKLGITKSHLAKVLSGKNKPSFELAVKLADALGKDLLFVAALGHNINVDTKQTRKSQSQTRKKKSKNGKGNSGTNRRK